MRQALLSNAQGQDKRQWTQIKKCEIPSEQNKALYCEGGQTLVLVV